MKRFYTNAVVKFLAFCLTALFSVGAVMLAFGAVNFAEQGCVPGQRYEDSAAYRSIMSGYIISAANLYRMQGEDLENSGLSFVDQQERQASREELEQMLDPRAFIGCCPSQVTHFLKDTVQPVVDRWGAKETLTAKLEV